MKKIIKLAAAVVVTVSYLLLFVVVVALVSMAHPLQRLLIVPLILLPTLGIGYLLIRIFTQPKNSPKIRLNLLAFFLFFEFLMATISCGMHFHWWVFLMGLMFLVLAIRMQEGIRTKELWEQLF